MTDKELVIRLANAMLRLIGFIENHVEQHSTMTQTPWRVLYPIKQEIEDLLTKVEDANAS